MSSMRRGVATAIVGALACAVMAAGLAWACTPQAQFTRFAPTSGGPGTQVTVTGTNFTDQPVTIHWGSASGPVIGTASGPSFTTTVTVPQAPGDVYAIVAVTIGPSPAQSGQAVGSFTLLTPTQPATGSTSASTSGATSGQTATPSPQAGGRTSATVNGAPATATQRGRTAATVSGANTARPSFPQRQPVATRNSDAPAVVPATPATAPTQAAARPQGTAAGTGRSANRGRADAAPASAPATFGAPSVSGATESSATGDLWTGFDPARSAASAASAATAAPQADAATSPATLGIVLLALGLIGLCGGAAVAETRRRRRARMPRS